MVAMQQFRTDHSITNRIQYANRSYLSVARDTGQKTKSQIVKCTITWSRKHFLRRRTTYNARIFVLQQPKPMPIRRTINRRTHEVPKDEIRSHIGIRRTPTRRTCMATSMYLPSYARGQAGRNNKAENFKSLKPKPRFHSHAAAHEK